MLSAVTNHRRPTRSIDASRAEDLAALGASDVRQIAEREGRCPVSPAFPTAQQPILDESIFGGGTPPSATPTPVNVLVVKRLEGFAADGVASGDIRVEGGRIEAATKVEDNVYVRTTGLPTDPVREIVALDSDGNVLFSKCLLKGGC